MTTPVSSQAEQFAADFCRHWQERLNFVFPLAMVEDLAVRYDAAISGPVYGIEWGKMVVKGPGEWEDGRQVFDGSTGTPPSGVAGIPSPPVPGQNS